MDGYCYDSAGNLLDAGACPSSGPHQYVYDAENRLISSNYGASTYTYNAEGKRISKTTGGVTMTYTYDRDGHLFETYGQTNSLMENYVAGRHLGTWDWNSNDTGTVYHYTHADWLGTERARIDVSGNLCETITSLPFGDGMTTSGSCSDTSNMHFTGKERDSESGLDNFGARYDASNFGRFMTPDWSASSEPIPYSNTSDPETLNLYTYAGNNPVGFADPDGHRHQECQTTTVTFHDPDGTVTSSSTTTCQTVSDWWDFFPFLTGAMGHHLVSEWDKIAAGEARNWIQKTLATGPLKDPAKNYYNAAHRAYNDAVRGIVRQMEKELGKDISQFSRKEVAELAKRVLTSADSRIQGFLDSLGETRAGVTARPCFCRRTRASASSGQIRFHKSKRRVRHSAAIRIGWSTYRGTRMC